MSSEETLLSQLKEKLNEKQDLEDRLIKVNQEILDLVTQLRPNMGDIFKFILENEQIMKEKLQ